MVTSRAALARLPVIRKSELVELQKAERPFGGFATSGWGNARRRARLVFASPGPLYEPEGNAADYWRLARPLFAAGFRAGDLVHNCFSYHFTPGGAMLESGAQALGCTVFRGGTGQTEQQVQAMVELRPDGYVGTPAVLPGASPCGRTNMRIKGWLGRADQTTKVKGMFVHPSQVAAIVKRHPEIIRARLIVDNPNSSDRMTLHVEVAGNASTNADAIVVTIRDVTKLRGEVSFQAPGALANDGKVVDDVRKYD